MFLMELKFLMKISNLISDKEVSTQVVLFPDIGKSWVDVDVDIWIRGNSCSWGGGVLVIWDCSTYVNGSCVFQGNSQLLESSLCCILLLKLFHYFSKRWVNVDIDISWWCSCLSERRSVHWWRDRSSNVYCSCVQHF